MQVQKRKNFILMAMHDTTTGTGGFFSRPRSSEQPFNSTLKVMWRNYTNCTGSSALTMLLWRFMFLPAHPASPMKSKIFTCASWSAQTHGLRFFQYSQSSFPQHCWQGMFFHKTSDCIFPFSTIFQTVELFLQYIHSACAAITRTPQLIKFQHPDCACRYNTIVLTWTTTPPQANTIRS